MPRVYIEDILRPRDKELDLQGSEIEELKKKGAKIQTVRVVLVAFFVGLVTSLLVNGLIFYIRSKF